MSPTTRALITGLREEAARIRVNHPRLAALMDAQANDLDQAHRRNP